MNLTENSMKVVIEKSEDGQFSVGIEAGDTDMGAEQGAMLGGQSPGAKAPAMSMMGGGMASEGQEDQGMSPAKDIEDALNQARQLLSGGEGGDPNEMWNRVQRDRALADQPGGPLMGQPR